MERMVTDMGRWLTGFVVGTLGGAGLVLVAVVGLAVVVTVIQAVRNRSRRGQ